MWIHLPKSYRSVQESDNLISASDWRFLLLEQSAMLKSKHSLSASWYRAWKRDIWMTRLCGQICEPSMAHLGVEKWIQSLEDTLANHFLPQENEMVQMILDIFGLTSSKLSQKSDQDGASSRTLRDILHLDMMKSKDAWKQLVIKLRKEYSQRKKSAHPTDESDYSSWRTPSQDQDGGTFDLNQRPEGSNPKMKLRDQAANWPTPQSLDSMDARPFPALVKQMNGARKGRTKVANLKEAVVYGLKWGTPNHRDWKDGVMSEANVDTNALLGRQAARWQTPMKADDGAKVTIESQQNSLISQQNDWYSRQNQTIQTRGQKLLSNRPALNPRFSEWLMGWIPGWTHPSLPIAESDFQQWEMELSRSLLDMLHRYYGLNSEIQNE